MTVHNSGTQIAGFVEEVGEGRAGQLFAVVRVGDYVAPSPADALAVTGGFEGHPRDDLNEEVIGELG